ncbi:uncharacterized protein AKAW2_40513A [Aspergillus luchuensis]|uniref:Uncharacterized protein n=1 Tax=Aspergillus kawachii TaxID=1069201 RepID=A0A7R7W9K4_ASPKA|nr:uncharacterized protein AKAW2_40513A [Aspergillus luchuensis]BCR98830.1 hypothetical protein AKAW2_40513A [Aspergillus luchuensis]
MDLTSGAMVKAKSFNGRLFAERQTSPSAGDRNRRVQWWKEEEEVAEWASNLD